MRLLTALEELLSALLPGDAGESQRMMLEAAPLFEHGTRGLTREQLTRAMELHDRCNAAALSLREKTLGDLGDIARSRRATTLYRTRR